MGIKIIAKNKRASYDYFLLERYEAGIELQGTEVKSIRLGKVALLDSYVVIDDKNEAWIYNLFIAPYTHGNILNHEERRKRKLLLHKREIIKLKNSIRLQGLTLIPTIIYFKRGRIKLEIATAKGKKNYDKRHVEAEKDAAKMIKSIKHH